MLNWLTECTGDDIWSVEYCKSVGVPNEWIETMSDIYESGFRSDRETIYHNERVTNQYRGVRDFDLANKIGIELGVPVDRIAAVSPTRRSFVSQVISYLEEESI